MKNHSWKALRSIFWCFFKIGPVTFGGGYAMIPLLEQEIVQNRKWVKQDEIADVLAIAQTAPGAVAVNSAIFVGYRLAGIKGAIAAVSGVLLPTLCIVLTLSIFYLYFIDNHKVAAAFEGIRPAIVALIVYAGYRILKTAAIDATTFVFALITLVGMILLGSAVHPVLVILAGAVFGLLVVKFKAKLQRSKQRRGQDQGQGQA